MADIVIGAVSWERMIGAVQKVRERLQRATTALEQAKVPYAVIGGNAVAAWVSRVDEAAVRNTQDVDILLRRADLERAKAALAHAGFVYHHSAGMDMFLDGPRGKARLAPRYLRGRKSATGVSRARSRRHGKRGNRELSASRSGRARADETHIVPR